MAEVPQSIVDQVCAIILVDAPYKNCNDFTAAVKNRPYMENLNAAVVRAAKIEDIQNDNWDIADLTKDTKNVLKQWVIDAADELTT